MQLATGSSPRMLRYDPRPALEGFTVNKVAVSLHHSSVVIHSSIYHQCYIFLLSDNVVKTENCYLE